MLDPSDTIVAVASHPGPAARGIVRLSGPRALAIATDGFEEATSIPSRPSRYAGRISLGRSSLPADLLLWPGPRSYTGQPIAEVHTIGAPPILEGLVTRSLALGARRAERGEFTLRAFLAGRIDLAQAEAVLRVIEAKGPAQLDLALRGLAGGIAGPARDLRDRLLDRLVELEAHLDFVEESDVPPVVRAALIDDLAASSRRLDELVSRLAGRDRPDVRPKVVLDGRPNAGKSRLFNALLGGDRAIVSPTPGTTRDDLVAPSEVEGLAFDLIDVAGEESAASPVAVAAQSRRSSRLAEADLILLCVTADEWEAGGSDDDPRTLRVATKLDLATTPPAPPVLATSARLGIGLDALRSAIAGRLRDLAGDVPGVGPEVVDGLRRAGRSVGAALVLASGGGPEELVAAEVRQAIDDLGAVAGAVVSEDILDRIFRRFCVGK